MPRENSFSDSDGRSLTPDLEDEIDPFARPASPRYSAQPTNLHTTRTRESVRSPPHSAKPVYPPTFIAPKERFRRAVQKVIALRQGTNVLDSGRVAGAEPGVDVLKPSADAEYGSLRANTVIDIIDYSAVRSNVRRMANHQFVEFMNDFQASEPQEWVKVRWINIGGVSWDVIKAVSIRYNLHPLALDDILHAHPRARSKVDYYNQHLFMRILCHELDESERQTDHLKRSRSAAAKPVTPLRPGIRHRREKRGTTPALAKAAFQTATAPGLRSPDDIESPALRKIKKQARISVNVAPMFAFLLRDGTVITMHSNTNLDMTEPIAARLRQFDSVLRTSADASLLIQSLLGLVADMALEVVHAYEGKIRHFERQILSHPTMETVRDLHILSADLMLHRRTLDPITTVVSGLRRYDVDRVAALLDEAVQDTIGKDVQVVGYMSKKAQTYLADVNDNMDYVLSQLDMIAGIGENLVTYTFNLTSYEMNEVMRRLTLASIIFLPLTLLAGYAGMNFQYPDVATNMWFTSHKHNDVTFWAIAIPVLAVTMAIFLGPDIRRMVSYVRKKVLTQNALKSIMQN
ncbi:CorA-like protein [Mycena indigotica]|uniref:CorA-like protein n=1 Tax=Mycena indigotica TaxID=2126181 RepID=A0A8H6TEW3_9AGAR|nr:CorA-like protein [Mycena indigotica]KAF7316448.1 CorA-like protein [Mycena indigotica]